MKQTKAFIVDDDAFSINTLRFMLEQHCKEIKVVGEADNYIDAVLSIEKTKPDILFLDINLGSDKSGFHVLDRLRNFHGSIVVISAHQNHAIQAFQYGAVHYLLKPISPIDLLSAIQRIKLSNTQNHTYDVAEQKIALPFKSGLEMVLPDDIVYLEADGSYCKIFMKDKRTITISRNLKYVSAILEEFSQFIRIHKSYMVNKNHIVAYKKTDGGQLELSTANSVPVSLTYKASVIQLLQR